MSNTRQKKKRVLVNLEPRQHATITALAAVAGISHSKLVRLAIDRAVVDVAREMTQQQENIKKMSRQQRARRLGPETAKPVKPACNVSKNRVYCSDGSVSVVASTYSSWSKAEQDRFYATGRKASEQRKK